MEDGFENQERSFEENRGLSERGCINRQMY